MTDRPVRIETVGENATPIWGMTNTERVRRIAAAIGWGFEAEDRTGSDAGSVVTVDLAYAFDPIWLHHIVARPGSSMTLDGDTVIAHGHGAEVFRAEDPAGILNEKLRKREQPFVLPLVPGNVRAIERASYFGAYKGVTDVLTKYLWPEWALVLTRLCARAGITPNMVTAVGAILCVAATVLFGFGHYWTGMAAGLGFMVLDTVDGKLARCTITSSYWGNVFDHGIDLIHPPFWWYAWGLGLAHYGRPLDDATFLTVMVVIVVGYVAQRLVEGAFIKFLGMDMHVWQRIDSRFRLITARRNPNMVILFASVIAGRPDLGLIAVAWWTALSCVFHVVRLAQALAVVRRGGAIRSWLD